MLIYHTFASGLGIFSSDGNNASAANQGMKFIHLQRETTREKTSTTAPYQPSCHHRLVILVLKTWMHQVRGIHWQVHSHVSPENVNVSSSLPERKRNYTLYLSYAGSARQGGISSVAHDDSVVSYFKRICLSVSPCYSVYVLSVHYVCAMRISPHTDFSSRPRMTFA